MSYEFAPALGKFEPIDIEEGMTPTSGWSEMLDDWYAYLTGGDEPLFSGRNNLRVFAMLSAAIDSINQCKPAKISGDPRYASAFA